jgi:small subunit ribosomal protein S16
MLVIRMQRTGRKGHAQFRVVVQDSRRTPTSGRIVAALGSYDPHAKTVILDKEKASFYLTNGAQPSDRVARLLKSEGVKLPSWVALESAKERATRNPDKLRKNRPAEPEAPAEEAPVAEDAVVEETVSEETTETAEAATEEASTETSEEKTEA